MLVAIIGFIIAMVAPGNNVRLLTVDESNRLSFPMAIIHALVYSVVCFGKWMTICFIAVILFCSVIFYSFAQNSKYEFKNPFLVFILCYGIYASVEKFFGVIHGNDDADFGSFHSFHLATNFLYSSINISA